MNKYVEELELRIDHAIKNNDINTLQDLLREHHQPSIEDTSINPHDLADF